MRSSRPDVPAAALCLALVATLAAPTAAPARESATSLEAALSETERRADELQPGNELRRLCREQRRVEHCIDALEALTRRRPAVAALRYNVALAYVDALPGRSLLRQGSLSTHSIEHVSAVLAQTPDDWLALYIRGLNNLYWPSWFGRTKRALVDLERCVALSERASGAPVAHHALGYAALGDAQVKSGDVAKGQRTWARGLERHPASTELRERAALPAASAQAFVNAQRDLDRPIDTDLAFLWRRP